MIGCGGEIEGDDGLPLPENPEILEFTSSVEAIPRGEAVELRWKVARAKMVTIFSGTEILISTPEAEGSVTTLPIRERSSFTLRATGRGPAQGRTLEVDAIWPEPRVAAFTAEPQTTIQQGFVMLRWETENTESVSLLANDLPVPNGTFIGQAARSFSTMVQVQSATTTFTLKATNPTHTIEEHLEVYAIPPPMFTEFRATPRTFIGSSTVATLTWDSVGFDLVELLVNYSPVPGFPTPNASGSHTTTIFERTDFTMIGWVGGMQYTQVFAFSSRAALEFEPNDDWSSAQYITNEGGVRGSIARESDVDYFYVDVFEPADVRIWVRGEGPGCPTDTSIELIAGLREEPMVIGSDQDDGIPTGRGGACAEISHERDDFANAISGTFFIAVRGERGETGSYVLMVEGTRPR
jgi:hypothetical protein